MIIYLFISCACIQALFWMFLFRRITRNKTGQIDSDQAVSVIVCYKNEAHILSKNLPSLCEQSHQNYEIIVVDDQSTDNTLALLQNYSVKVVQTEKSSSGKKAAITTAVSHAQNDVLLLTDADCKASSKTWVAKMAGCVTDKKKIVLGYGPMNKLPGMVSTFARYETWFTAVQYFSYAMAGIPYMGVGRNLLYTKDLFKKQGGFKDHMDLASGDDDLFVSGAADKDNTAICLDPDTFMYSDPKTTLKAYIRQKSRHISTAVRYEWHHKILLTFFSGTHVLFYLLFFYLLFSGELKTAVAVIVLKWIVQQIVNLSLMKKLKEVDLWRWFPILDFMTFLYYILLTPFLFFKNRKAWK